MSGGVLRVPNSTPHAIAAFINQNVTYKPGYELRAYVPMGLERDSVQLVLIFKGWNSRKPNRPPDKLCFQRVYPIANMELLKFVEMILTSHVHEWECHEADEWLKIGGKIIRDPHA